MGKNWKSNAEMKVNSYALAKRPTVVNLYLFTCK